MNVCVTGANGFVGRALSTEVISRGLAVQSATRTPCNLPKSVKNVVVGSIDGSTDWRDARKR